MGRKTVYNNICTPELIAQISDENKELMDGFLEYLHSLDRSPNTISGYQNDLEIFFVWNVQHNKNKFFIDFTKRDIVNYPPPIEAWACKSLD